MVNALPYLFLIVIYGALAVCFHYDIPKGYRIKNTILCAIIFLFFFGFRGFIFHDWVNYYLEFYSFRIQNLFSFQVGGKFYEPGFSLLILLCKSIWNNYHFFAFICSLINILLLLRFLRKYTKNIPLAIIIFLSFSGILFCCDTMRNTLAILIFANAIPFLSQRRPVPYFLYCLLALSFHASALIYFPLYFFLHRRFNRWILLGIFLAANVIYLGHIPILKAMLSLVLGTINPMLQLKIDTYLSLDVQGSRLSIGYLERLFTAGLLFCYYDKLLSIRKENTIFVNSLLLYLIFFLMLSEFSTIATRISYLFIYTYWVIWLDFMDCFSIRNNKLLYACFLALYCLLRTYGTCTTPLAAYENILFEHKTYNERLVIFRRCLADEK